MSNEERELLEWFRYHLRAKGTGIGRILRKAKEMGSGIARTAHDDWAEIEAKADVCEALLASTEPEQPTKGGICEVCSQPRTGFQDEVDAGMRVYFCETPSCNGEHPA
ncbi:MAG: hypothetical protein IIB38_03600, partial [Candidatus Hydrogenedentes bacterium]|nr:hypothetical protein [Candidatus Hydrogenedentota bacterium]